MPFYEVTKTRSETLLVEAEDPREARAKAREAESSWERYKWSEGGLEYDVSEVPADAVAESLEAGEVVR